mmetsp:Transcript_82037/g.145371  ORF Transcript_82037/g.145371 Transcript_82037/m.145371 type:complete len:313 (+) Transcript_82037:127-1065(+)
MKMSRPDVSCNASRLHGPSDLRLTKSKWMEILNENLDRGTRNYWRSATVQDLSKLGHGTWSHVSYGDPVGDMKIDKAVFGERKAKQKHIATAVQSGKDWQHPKHRGQEHSNLLLAGSSSLEQTSTAATDDALLESCKSSTVPLLESQRSSVRSRQGLGMAPRADPDKAGWSQRTPSSAWTPGGRQRRQAPVRPQLPPLWAAQPRYSEDPGFGTYTPSASSAARSSSAASVPGLRGSLALQRQQHQSHLPLRRVESEPKFLGLRAEPSGPVGSSGPVGAALMAHVLGRPHPSKPPSEAGQPSGCRYTGTFVFG